MRLEDFTDAKESKGGSMKKQDTLLKVAKKDLEQKESSGKKLKLTGSPKLDSTVFVDLTKESASPGKFSVGDKFSNTTFQKNAQNLKASITCKTPNQKVLETKKQTATTLCVVKASDSTASGKKLSANPSEEKQFCAKPFDRKQFSAEKLSERSGVTSPVSLADDDVIDLAEGLNEANLKSSPKDEGTC